MPTRRDDGGLRGRVARTLVGLESHEVVTKALRLSRLPDLDGMEFAEPLEVLCRSLDGEARLHLRGRSHARLRLVTALARRGRIGAAATTQPMAPIDAPIVLLGAPDAGVHRLAGLLAADVRLRADPGWDDDLLATAMTTVDFERSWHVPSYAEWIDTADLAPAYAQLAKGMGVEQAADPARRWVLRSMQHLEQVDTLLGRFPDAVLVQIHRDPDAVAAELAASIATERARWSDAVDPSKVAAYWGWRYERMLDRAAAARERRAGVAVLDVDHADLVADHRSVVRAVYDAAGLEPAPGE